MSEPRYVIVRVDDERVTHVRVEQLGDVEGGPMCIYSDIVPAPTDGQVAEDVDAVTQNLGSGRDGWNGPTVSHGPLGAAARLRAAFGLDEEES